MNRVALYERFARVYLNGGSDHDSDKEKIEAWLDDEEEPLSNDAECYIVFTPAVSSTGMLSDYTKWGVDVAIIDSRSNISLTSGSRYYQH